MNLDTCRESARSIALSGAWLIMASFATGLWAGAAMSGVVAVPLPRLALSAHLNALMGGLWLLAFASTVSYLHFDQAGTKKLALWIQVSTWGNWAITLLASFLGVTGLNYTGERTNDLVAFLLQVLVVVPAFVGTGFWLYGFQRRSHRG